MKTTRNKQPADFLGADLTDRYSRGRRPVDVCGLTCDEGQGLRAGFWVWEWPETGVKLDVAVIADEVQDVNSAMLDGPQGLASVGETMRVCERQSGAVGKTPDTVPQLDRPFAGYIRSSLELFSAFGDAKLQISPAGFAGGVSEVYPGNIWCRLVNRTLPKKSTAEGRRSRKLILQTLGVTNLPELPSHDQNDACICAVLAAAADNQLEGVTVKSLGLPLEVDPDGTLREGPMVIPEISQELLQEIEQALRVMPDMRPPQPARRIPAEQRVQPQAPANPGPAYQAEMDRANLLRDILIEAARNGDAQVCTYAWTYRHIFATEYENWAQGYGDQVVSISRSTAPADLRGLGAVRLDAFIVNGKTGLPSAGHWESAEYDREDWERVLGTAAVRR